MKSSVFCIVLFLLAATGAFAQGYPLMGKIVDAHGKSVRQAALSAARNEKTYPAKVNGGLYYTEKLQPGKYDVTIIANSVVYSLPVTLKAPAGKTNLFYNFKLIEGEAILTVSNEDPFMETALNDAAKDNDLIDRPSRNFIGKQQDFSLLPADDQNGHRIVPANKNDLNYEILDKVKNSPDYYIDGQKKRKR